MKALMLSDCLRRHGRNCIVAGVGGIIVAPFSVVSSGPLVRSTFSVGGYSITSSLRVVSLKLPTLEYRLVIRCTQPPLPWRRVFL